MKIRNSYLVICSILVGIIFGLIGGPVFVLILWAILGLAIGYISYRKKIAVISGTLYGFFLSFVFMVHGYSGTDPLVTKLLPFIALGIFGAFCGAILALIGSLIPRKN